jgi:mRNA interferase YafQ
MARLKADFSAKFTRDLKKKAKKRQWDLSQLENLIELILDNSSESTEILKQRHNMHTLSGKWLGSYECHVANAGDWLVIWAEDNHTAYFERTGSHDELFR